MYVDDLDDLVLFLDTLGDLSSKLIQKTNVYLKVLKVNMDKTDYLILRVNRNSITDPGLGCHPCGVCGLVKISSREIQQDS